MLHLTRNQGYVSCWEPAICTDKRTTCDSAKRYTRCPLGQAQRPDACYPLRVPELPALQKSCSALTTAPAIAEEYGAIARQTRPARGNLGLEGERSTARKALPSFHVYHREGKKS